MDNKSISSGRNWDEFINTGLMTFVNIFLQIFGWNIRVVKDEFNHIERVYPVRIANRNINEDEFKSAHIDLNYFLNKNLKFLTKEIADIEEESDNKTKRRAKSRVSLEDIFKR